MKTIATIAGAAAVFGALSFAPAQAAYLQLTPGTGAAVPTSPDNKNQVIPGSTLGFFEQTVEADFDAIGGRQLRLTYVGMSAGWYNTFQMDTNADGIWETIFSTESTEGETTLVTLTGYSGQGALAFRFEVNDGADKVTNGVDNTRVNGAPNFFSSFAPDGDGTATSGRSLWLALDDSGKDWDDNHDDLVVGMSVTPLPAAVWFLITAVGGLFGTRWLRKDASAAA
ncbi:hypothetical protein F1188_06345 [Roseospira marina]|uniref:VPLPA-CTERM sorting domain-containing protein n=1 Tax=Roseospira marina TaxID=140057 RepID=A0A5M6IDW4_9PROT|nr:VPLPA-CTERM sorting domain-containing protein [Roseospira marina]KAA5606480.1 hypothetical protein F1188_06345 [Roseospira marina]MBB4314099.1 hypothetical protein [Roseospira marina]MBB5087260.1 hypothetical protein [Roseospira marina]